MKDERKLQIMKPVFDYLAKYENKNVAFKNMGRNKVELAQLFCRSSIFKAVDDGVEVAEVIHHIGSNIEIEVRPISLSQDDLDVLLILLLECSRRDSYKFIYPMKDMIKMLGKGYGSNSVKKVKMHLKNLSMFLILVEKDDVQITGGIVRAKATSKGIAVDFYDELMPLFEYATHINIEHRFKLPAGLTRYMYNWIMSSDIPVKMDSLKLQAGRSHRTDVKHKSDIKVAMNKIKELGVIEHWGINIHNQLHWIKS